MGWQEWVRVLGGGAFGAMLGLVGVYFVFRATTRRDRESARDDRTAESVAKVIVAANQLILGMSAQKRRRWLERAMAEFVLATQLFAAREIKEHPEVTNWLLAETNRLVEVYRGCPPGRWFRSILPWRVARKLASEMSLVNGHLVVWRAGGRSAEWFKEQTPKG